MAHFSGKLVVYDSRPAPLTQRLAAHGYPVRAARSLSELEASATRERPALVIGDLAAAGSTPVEVCRRLKSSLLLRHLPVVVLTHDGKLESRVAAVNSGADDYLVEPLEDAELLARINRAIERARASLDANPLTGLPGNTSIKAEMSDRLARGTPFAVLFIDLDHFKAFNDRYGFERGDAALHLLGDIVLDTIGARARGSSADFAGNIGGDDFVLITTAERAERHAARICRLVSRRMPSLYDEADRRAGFIASIDRQGGTRRFPLMSVSVAIVTNEERRFAHPGEIAQIGSEIKHYLKQLPGSRFLKNRRHSPAPAAGPLPVHPALLRGFQQGSRVGL